MENPTRYHLLQKTKNLQNSSSLNTPSQQNLTFNLTSNPNSNANSPLNPAMSENTNSNWDTINNSSTTDSPLSDGNSEADDFVEELNPIPRTSNNSRVGSFEIQHEINTIEQVLHLPKTVRLKFLQKRYPFTFLTLCAF